MNVCAAACVARACTGWFLRPRWLGRWMILALGLFAAAGSGFAQERGEVPSPDELKQMSIEELMNLEVMSVSRRPERLSEAASAVQVITREDIQRAGVTTLPEALRLASNLHVAQLSAWATVVAARGFSALFANKLLVMIDGRTVYTPLFAGVFWDVQNLVLDDIDRIEVVSGPGGTLWGANAVNGVINIITRSASDTQGVLVSAAGGTHLKRQAVARYGGRIGENLSFRFYGQHFDHDNSLLPNGDAFTDAWRLTHGGFRADWQPTGSDVLSFQGNLYSGTIDTAPDASKTNGKFVMTSWSRTFSAASDLSVQAYYDRTWRIQRPDRVTDEVVTYDFDAQHRFPLARRHGILWGAGYRLIRSEVRYATSDVALLPPRKTLQLFSGFVQDEIALVPDRLNLTVGAKVEHHTYTGFEVQPSTRLAWMPGTRHTLWGAVSRAVRAPSRIDRDIFIPGRRVPPPDPSVAGGPHFESEALVAYELGYRVQPFSGLSLSLAGFRNAYTDLYSVEALPGTQTYQIMNGSEGEVWGAEVFGTYQPAAWWRMRGGYTYLNVDLRSRGPYDTSSLANDPKHQALLQSMLDLPGGFQLDVWGRYTDKLPHQTSPNVSVPAYVTLDARLGWAFRSWEIAVVGQNLWQDRHREFSALEVPRGVYGKVTWRNQ